MAGARVEAYDPSGNTLVKAGRGEGESSRLK